MKAFASLGSLCMALTIFYSPLTPVVSSPASAQTAVPSEDRAMLLVPENLAELEDALTDIRSLLDKFEKADSDGGLLTNGKADYQAKLNSELEALLDTFSGNEYSKAQTELAEADLAITTGEDQLERLKSDLRLAPKGNGQLSIADRAMMRDAASGSENAIKEEMATTQAAIDTAKTARADAVAGFVDVMAERFGFIVPQEQATALLYQVNGYSIVQSKIVFETIVALEQHLRVGLDEQSSAATVQRYYSVAAVSRLMLVRMYQLHLEQYEARWLPRLAEIEAENTQLMAATRTSISEAKAQTQRAQLTNNLSIQEKTREAIGVYQNLLEKRRQNTLRGLAMAEGEAAVAINTLKTLEGVFGLSAEMFSNTSEYEALMGLSTPELLPLDGEMLDQNFIALNQKLGA